MPCRDHNKAATMAAFLRSQGLASPALFLPPCTPQGDFGRRFAFRPVPALLRLALQVSLTLRHGA